MRAMRRLRLVALTLVALLLAPAPSHAQDTPTVFIHGLSSSAATWANAASRLQGRLALEPFIPALPWTEPYETQATALRHRLPALPSRTVVLGHSNGGIVGREYSRHQALTGLVTLGTPHAGAPLVANALHLAGFQQALYAWAGLAWSAFGGSALGQVLLYVQGSLIFAGDVATGTLRGLAALLGTQAAVPVSAQMLPGSSYLHTLNSAANVTRESSAVRARIGVAYTARNYWMMGPARALQPDDADARYRDLWVAVYVLELASQYVRAAYPPWNGAAMLVAEGLSRVAYGLRMVDPYWCWAVTNDWSCSTPHDGVVPVWSQVYPGALTLAITGPAHIQETSQSDEPLVQVLTSRLGVASRGTASPPPPPAPSPDTLIPDQSLAPGARLVSASGAFELAYQHDGNLVLYRLRDGAALWASGTGAAPGRALMQMDGNLVLWSGDGRAVWSTGTIPYPGARLVLQNDGNLVVYSAHGAPLWQTGTAQ